MEESPVPKEKRRINSELIVALSAIFVSIVTLFVYIYQANIMRKQQYASVWPHVIWDMMISSEEGFYIFHLQQRCRSGFHSLNFPYL
jgi:hypothetical protein